MSTGVFNCKKRIANENINLKVALLKEHPELINNINNTVKYICKDLKETDPKLYNKNNKKTFVKILDYKTIQLCKLLNYNNENRFLVLNIANENSPGGGWLQGISGDEEELFLCSSYCLSLNKKYYPIKDIVYTPGVLVFRDNEDYSILPKNQRFYIDFIAVSPINKPNLTITGHLNENDKDLTYCKIRSIFRVAKNNNYNQIVLGAFGCGIFRNNPFDIARIFKEVINSYEFKNVFIDIYFAIDTDTKKEFFSIFKSILEED